MIARRRPLLSLVLLAAALCSSGAVAEEIYVDNRTGSDTYDGLSSDAAGIYAGPVRTIRRALFLARQGDTIVIANRGVPYYEQLMLNGRHHSGFDLGDFTILGNGAVVSGALLVPPIAWEEAGPDLWKFEPKRKGHYQLIRDDAALPELAIEPGTRELPEIPHGQWAAWRGAIYYRSLPFESPLEQEFAFADGDVGLSLSEVHDVVIVGLTFRHFRLDGVSAHSQCRNILLDKVQSLENGRSGLFAGDTSQVEAFECTFEGNRRHNVLIRGNHAAVKIQPEPAEAPAFID